MRNTGWLLLEQIFRMALSLIVTSLMARYLGTEDFGLINYGLAFVMIFTSASNLGIESIIVNEIIKNRKDTGKLIGTTIYLRLCASLISIVLVYFTVSYLNPGDKMILVITVIQSFSLLFVVFDSVKFWFQSNLQSKFVVISKSIAFTIVSCWRISLIFFAKSIEYFSIATVVEAVTIAAFVVVFYKRFNGPKLSFSTYTAKRLLTQSFYFFISSLLIMVYTQIDKIMLGEMVGGVAVGIYTAAMTISNLWIFIPNALIESARPVIMTEKTQNENSYVKKFMLLYSSIIWIGIGASIVITLLAKPIILIVYGDQFIEATNVLILLIWSRIFSIIGIARSIWLVTEELDKYQLHFVAIGAIVNVFMNLLLIPKYGAVGAAIATLFAEVISAFIAILFFKKTRPLFYLIVKSVLFRK